MSFAQEIKQRLCEAKLQDCCGVAFGCGLLFSHAGHAKKYLLRTEICQVVDTLNVIYHALTGQDLPVIFPDHFAVTKAKLPPPVHFLEPWEGSRKAILAQFGHWEAKSGKIMPVAELIKKDCCKRAFARGLFIGCGVISDPEKEYHLELSFSTPSQVEGILTILNKCHFTPKQTSRAGRYALYFKDSGQIEDFLVYVGDNNAMFELSNIRILKDFRNTVNRRINCDMANLDRTVTVAQKQVEDIRLIISRLGLDSLTDELKQTAMLRMESSEMSLAQMSKELGVGRSGVNHRLKKLSELAEKIRQGGHV